MAVHIGRFSFKLHLCLDLDRCNLCLNCFRFIQTRLTGLGFLTLLLMSESRLLDSLMIKAVMMRLYELNVDYVALASQAYKKDRSCRYVGI